MKFFAIAGVAASALFTVALSTPADAQQWPARQVRLIVPYPAGGNVDSAARVIADRLQAKLGQPFIVENKAGAGGLIAGEAFAKAAPDGYACSSAPTARCCSRPRSPSATPITGSGISSRSPRSR